MLIGELSSRSGFSRDAIRFYEKHGLLQLSKKLRRGNNYKEYPEEFVTRLLTIRRLKEFGFTLNEIAGLLEMIEVKTATCENVEGLIGKKVELLDKRRREMTALRDQLSDGVQKCRGRWDAMAPGGNCPILVSEGRR